MIAETDAAAVAAAFVPAGLAVVSRELRDLSALKFTRSPEPAYPSFLRSARLPDRHVRVVVSGLPDPSWRLTDGAEAVGLVDAITTAERFPDGARLAWLIDGAGAQVSNKVAIDEPESLRAVLQDRQESSGDRPAGIEAADLETPVGQMLARLHGACIFDFDDTPTGRRVGRAVEDDEDPEFWDRLAREDLRSDPRLPRYQQLQHQLELLDGLFLDIARMRDRVPSLSRIGLASESDGGNTEDSAPRPRWTPDRRLQVRLYNLLERWCAAISDPRLLWISPAAPIGNYAALVAALHECWVGEYLSEPRVTSLVGALLGAMGSRPSDARVSWRRSTPWKRAERPRPSPVHRHPRLPARCSGCLRPGGGTCCRTCSTGSPRSVWRRDSGQFECPGSRHRLRPT